MRFNIRVTPRASSESIRWDEAAGTLHVRVTAPPADGAANAAVARALARALGIATRDVTLVSGAGGRNKVFDLPLQPDEVARRVAGKGP